MLNATEVQYGIRFPEISPRTRRSSMPGAPAGGPDDLSDEECCGIHRALLDALLDAIRHWSRVGEVERREWLDWISAPLPWGYAYREPTADVLACIRTLGAEAAACGFSRSTRRAKRLEIQAILKDAGCLVPGSFAACCMLSGLDPEEMQTALESELRNLMASERVPA